MNELVAHVLFQWRVVIRDMSRWKHKWTLQTTDIVISVGLPVYDNYISL